MLRVGFGLVIGFGLGLGTEFQSQGLLRLKVENKILELKEN